MKKITFLMTFLILTGCTSVVTLDKKNNDRNSGYSETLVSDNIMEVFYSSKRNQSLEKTKDLLLLSSAKLTTDKGYKFFKIISEDIKKIDKENKKPVDIYSDYYREEFWIHDIEVVQIDKYHIYEGNQKIMLSNKNEEGYLEASKIKENLISKYKGNLIIK